MRSTLGIKNCRVFVPWGDELYFMLVFATFSQQFDYLNCPSNLVISCILVIRLRCCI